MSNKSLSCLLMSILLYCSHVSAENLSGIDQTYIFFPFLHSEIRPNVGHDQDLEAFEIEAGSDFIYLLNYKNFRAMTEVLLTNEEIELERLQFGVAITPNNTLWLGRYHSPLGFWNSNYHHGLHLQTSVHRPGIIEFEDGGGILPNHVTGISLDGQRYTNTGIIHYVASFGYGPTIEDTLEPYSFLESENKLHSIIKIGYQADETNPSETGFVLGHSKIAGENSEVDTIQQNILGVYTHQSWDRYRLTTAAYLVKNKIQYTSSNEKDASFAAGYLHGEYDIANKWIGYVRVERSIGSKHDPYLDLFDHEETERNLGGIRYELTRRQALSSEVSQRIDEHDNHTHISLQWSAVFP